MGRSQGWEEKRHINKRFPSLLQNAMNLETVKFKPGFSDLCEVIYANGVGGTI